MDITAIRHKVRDAGFSIPFRFGLVLFVLVLLLAWRWLQKTNVLPDTAYTAIIALFIKISIFFIGALLIFNLLTVVIPWLILLYHKKNGRIKFTVKTASSTQTQKEKQEVFIEIKPLLKPVFGFLRLRLEYDSSMISPKFSLLSASDRLRFFPNSLKGKYYWPLRDIREYQVSGAIVYFEDMMQLFSFTTKLSASGKFFVQPAAESYASTECTTPQNG